MKKLLILTFTIFFFQFAKAQDTKVSTLISISVPHHGIKSLNHEMGGNYGVLFHGKDDGAGFVGGVSFNYNTAFKYKVLDTAFTRNTHVAEIILGMAIPESWNEFISGPAILASFGLGFKTDGEAYPNVPIKFAIALQQNFNIPAEFLGNMHVGIFARGTLGTFLYKDLTMEPEKNLKNNYFGTVEAGLRLFIVGEGSKSGRNRRR